MTLHNLNDSDHSGSLFPFLGLGAGVNQIYYFNGQIWILINTDHVLNFGPRRELLLRSTKIQPENVADMQELVEFMHNHSYRCTSKKRVRDDVQTPQKRIRSSHLLSVVDFDTHLFNSCGTSAAPSPFPSSAASSRSSSRGI